MKRHIIFLFLFLLFPFIASAGTAVLNVQGETRAEAFQCTKIDGEHNVNFNNTVTLTATPVAESVAGLGGKFWIANGVDWTSDYLLRATSGVATKITATDYTVGTTDFRECYGGIIYVTGNATITGCDGLADGMNYTIITIGASTVVADVQSDDSMILDGVQLSDGEAATNTSTAGDIIVFSYYSAAGWYAASGSPDGDHWTGP